MRDSALRESFAASPIYRLLGVTWTDSSIELTVDEHHVNVDGVLHGGIYTLLGDTAMGFAARSASGTTSNRTMGLVADFFAPAYLGDVVKAEASIDLVRGRFVWTTCTISTVRQQKVIMLARMTATNVVDRKGSRPE